MTALCGGGTSGALPGAQAVTLLASGFLAVALDLYGAPWLKWALPFLGLPELTLVSFCATDPPAIPVFTAAESKALMDLTVGADFNSGLSKFSDLVQHLAWRQLCTCTSGALVALPAAPAPPAGTPVYTTAPAQSAPSCGSGGTVFSQDQTVPSTGHSALVYMTWPAGTTSLKVRWRTGPNSGAAVFRIDPVGVSPTNGNQVYSSIPVPASVQDHTYYYTLPPGATDFSFNVVYLSGVGLTGFTVDVTAFCNGAPPQGTLQPCCPPDPTTQLQLDGILRMVTLLQRQLVPFAYISSTAHAGLIGQGSFAVQGLLGVRIDLTTMPASLTQDLSSPPFVYNVGWVSIQDANGFIDETRAHAQHQAWFSRIASDATLVGYSFAPGVVATITELQREP